MTIELTTFSAPQPGYKDKRIGNFALAFERKERRSATFANILVDATWATWMVHDDFPANEANAEIVLTGEASFYPDSAMIHIPAPHAEQAKNAFAVLMATWAQGQSTVLGYSVEESIVLAYRNKGPAGLFAFLLCSYMEAPPSRTPCKAWAFIRINTPLYQPKKSALATTSCPRCATTTHCGSKRSKTWASSTNKASS